MSSNRRLPNFFLVGAAKCGTTSLARYLDRRPEVFVCKPKEPNFYAFAEGTTPSCVGPASAERLHDVLLKYSVTSRDAYESLFDGSAGATAVGDASVRYLYESSAAERIAADCPGAKIVAVLRDPVARMHSHYHMNLKSGLEPLSFSEALAAEDQRVAAGWGWDWHYRRVGRYGEQLTRYFERFGRDRVLVLFHTDLAAEPNALWDRLSGFLGVDPDPYPDFSERALVGRSPKSPGLQRLLWQESAVKTLAKRLLPAGWRASVSRRVNAANAQAVPALSPEEHDEYAESFDEDRLRLETLLGRQMPW